MPDQKTAIVTGAGRGIGAGLVEAFLGHGYNVVATSRNASQSLAATPRLVPVDGDIGRPETAAKTVEAALTRFATIDVLVNNAGIFVVKMNGMRCTGKSDEASCHVLSRDSF